MSARSRRRQAKFRHIAVMRRLHGDPGQCLCGHAFHEHHNATTFQEGPFRWSAQECEWYGFNEAGGVDPGGRSHCQHYRPVRGTAQLRSLQPPSRGALLLTAEDLKGARIEWPCAPRETPQ